MTHDKIRVPENLAGKPMLDWVHDLINNYNVEEMQWEEIYQKYICSRNLVDFDIAQKTIWQMHFFLRFQAGCPRMFDHVFGVGYPGDLNSKPTISEELIIGTYGDYKNPSKLFVISPKHP